MLRVAKKYILAFPKNKEEEILELMKKDWSFEFIDKKEAKEESLKEIQNLDYIISSLDFVITYLSPLGKKQPLLEKIKNPKIMVEKKEIDGFEKEESLKAIIDKVIKAEKELKILEKDQKDKEKTLKELEWFGSLSFVPQTTQYAFSAVLKIEKQKQESFKKLCFDQGIHLKEINPGIYSIVGLKEKKETILKQAEVLPYNFSLPPLQEKEMISEQIKENKEKEELIKKELWEIARNLNEIKVFYDILCLKKRQAEFKKRSLANRFLNYIVFFAPEEEKKEFENKLPADVKIVETGLEKNEFPPVYIENNKVVEPFQSVTNIFGLPGHKEIDPTPYLAFFFILFFGICITDAGYGLILALLTGLPLLIFKERFKQNKLLKLLFYGGISTFIVGVLFGSYFGVSPEKLHLSFMKNLKVIDPIENTILFMGIAFFLGYLQICFSQIVKIIKSKKQKEKDEFLSGLVWLSFYLFSGIYMLSLVFAGLKTIGLAGLLVFLAGLFIVESKGQKIFLRPLVGLIKVLQGLINTMSDILSYSRLMALGLGTGVIALIVNQIAFLLGGMIPYVGWILTAVILIGGHLFNLGINALGGFIHSARLQFVEFFPKFMEGGGRRLNPIGQELKYIKINN